MNVATFFQTLRLIQLKNRLHTKCSGVLPLKADLLCQGQDCLKSARTSGLNR